MDQKKQDIINNIRKITHKYPNIYEVLKISETLTKHIDFLLSLSPDSETQIAKKINLSQTSLRRRRKNPKLWNIQELLRVLKYIYNNVLFLIPNLN